MIDIDTFGKTPSARYLVRTLQELNDESFIRFCSKFTTHFNTTVNQICVSVDHGTMTPKSAVNLLIMMRKEASYPNIDHRLIQQLLSCVVIGHIKRAIRKISQLRKLEIACASPNNKLHRIFDKETGEVILEAMGFVVAKINRDTGETRTFIPVLDDIAEHITPELLHQRSDARCLRQGKPHMMPDEDFLGYGG